MEIGTLLNVNYIACIIVVLYLDIVCVRVHYTWYNIYVHIGDVDIVLVNRHQTKENRVPQDCVYLP